VFDLNVVFSFLTTIDTGTVEGMKIICVLRLLIAISN
jgi:hypothetical protein